MVRADSVKQGSTTPAFTNNVFAQSDEERPNFPIDDLNHPENFYSATTVSNRTNTDYEIIDERKKSPDKFTSRSFRSKFGNSKLNHPFSASILKTTKSIADSNFKLATIENLGRNAAAQPEKSEPVRNESSFLWRNAKRLFSTSTTSGESGVKLKSANRTQSDHHENTPEYASIQEFKNSLTADDSGRGASYWKMIESFLHHERKPNDLSVSGDSCSVVGSNFIFGRRRLDITKSSEAAQKAELKSASVIPKAPPRKLSKPTRMNSSGLLSVNINLDETSPVSSPPQHSSSSSSSSSSASSTSDNCSEHSSDESNSKTGYKNQKEEPKVVRRQRKHLVELRAVFLKIGDIDTLNEKFMAEAFIEARWVDRDLSPSTKYNPETMWNPKLYIVNGLGELKQQVWFNQYSIGEYKRMLEKDKIRPPLPPPPPPPQQSSSDHSIETLSGDKIKRSGGVLGGRGCVILERRRISGQFWQTLNLKNFPADVQQLTISLSTPKHANEIDLVHCKELPSSVNHKCFKDSQEWRLYRHITVREYVRESVFSAETFPAIDLTINAARKPTFYYWNAFFLIFLITMASLSIFSIKCHLNANRIQTVCTLLLTSVTFKWITNRSLPTVSYMTSLDKYAIGCMLLLCAQIIWHAVVSSMLGLDAKCVQPYALYDYTAFIFFCGLFLTINFVFLFWLLRQTYTKRCELSRQEIDYANQIVGKRSTRLKSMLYGI